MKKKNDIGKSKKSSSETVLATAECGGTGPINNVTHDNPIHENAMVRVLVSGLSVFGFNPNPAHPRAEFGFVKDHHTLVKMEVYRNGFPNLYWSTQRTIDFPHPSTEDITITINSTRTGMGYRYEGTEGLPAPDDLEDFRRVPSFAELHGKRLDIKNNAKRKLSARLNIHDATFYTYFVSRSSTIRISKHDDHATETRELFRRIGRVIGADILSDTNLKFRIDVPPPRPGAPTPPPIEKELPWEAGVQYTIVITTETTHPGRHLELIYNDILQKPGKFRYELEYITREFPWHYSIFANKKSEPKFFYIDNSEKFIEIPSEDLITFSSIEKALEKKYKPGFKPAPRSTQFVCECVDGACGGLPPVP